MTIAKKITAKKAGGSRGFDPIARMSASDLRILELAKLDLTYAQIGARLGVSEGVAQKRVREAISEYERLCREAAR